jgi:hypothetical protein
MRTSRSVRLAIALMIAAACAPPVPSPRDEDEDTPLPDRSTEPAPRKSTTSETKKTEGSSDAQADAGSSDGEAGAKLPNGSACTTNEQCAGGVCVEIDDDEEARVCTQACEEDDDCPAGNDCDDGVCEVDD